MAFWSFHRALFFNDKGDYVDTQKFGIKKDFFTYGYGKEAHKYNILPKDCTIWFKKGLIFNNYYYFYNINNPNPLKIDKKLEPVLNSKIYNVMLETKVAQDLNDLASDGLARFLTPRNIIIAIIILGVIIYFASGGTLKGASDVVTAPG